MTTLCIPRLPRIFRNLYQMKFPLVEQEEKRREKKSRRRNETRGLSILNGPSQSAVIVSLIDSRGRHAKSHEGIPARIRDRADKCPKNSRCKWHRAKRGTRAVFPRVHPSRVRPAQFHFILLAPSLLLLLLTASPSSCDFFPLDPRPHTHIHSLQMCSRFRGPLRSIDVTPHDVCMAWRHEHVPRKLTWRKK